MNPTGYAIYFVMFCLYYAVRIWKRLAAMGADGWTSYLDARGEWSVVQLSRFCVEHVWKCWFGKFGTDWVTWPKETIETLDCPADYIYSFLFVRLVLEIVAGPNCHIEGVEIPTQIFMLTCATFSDHLHSFESLPNSKSFASFLHLSSLFRCCLQYLSRIC